MNAKSKLYGTAALVLVVAAGMGFAAARLTERAPVAAAQSDAKAASASDDTIAMSHAAIAESGITTAAAGSGLLDTAVTASATVEAAPDAAAVLTARAPGTISRIFGRIGDSIRAGETLALVESREASAIVADRAAAAARVSLARRQVARERRLLAQGVSPRADYETAEANLAVAEAEARRAVAAAGAARVSGDGRSVAVVSPVSGKITVATAHLGQFIAAETELFRVADASRLQITASLPPSDATRVRQGDRVQLTRGDGTILEGRVRSMTGVVDADTRATTVVIAPGVGSGALVPGQRIQVRIFGSGGSDGKTVLVPQDAIQTIGDCTVVFVRTKSGFRAQTVQVGGRSAGLASVSAGLAAGTQIATANAFLLKAEIEKEAAE